MSGAFGLEADRSNSKLHVLEEGKRHGKRLALERGSVGKPLSGWGVSDSLFDANIESEPSSNPSPYPSSSSSPTPSSTSRSFSAGVELCRSGPSSLRSCFHSQPRWRHRALHRLWSLAIQCQRLFIRAAARREGAGRCDRIFKAISVGRSYVQGLSASEKRLHGECATYADDVHLE
jgi:hypothetical protein